MAGLHRLSTSQRGLLYERACLDFLLGSLAPHNISDLLHRGGKGDKGIDFTGWLHANRSPRLRLIGQCKYFARRLGPAPIREFDSVLRSAFHRDAVSSHALLGIICSAAGYSDEAILLANNPDAQPLLLLHLAPTPSKIDDHHSLGLHRACLNVNGYQICGSALVSDLAGTARSEHKLV